MPSPRLRAPGLRDPISATPAEELAARATGRPAALAAALRDADAARPSRLADAVLGMGIRHWQLSRDRGMTPAGRERQLERALYFIGVAREMRAGARLA